MKIINALFVSLTDNYHYKIYCYISEIPLMNVKLHKYIFLCTSVTDSTVRIFINILYETKEGIIQYICQIIFHGK